MVRYPLSPKYMSAFTEGGRKNDDMRGERVKHFTDDGRERTENLRAETTNNVRR